MSLSAGLGLTTAALPIGTITTTLPTIALHDRLSLSESSVVEDKLGKNTRSMSGGSRDPRSLASNNRSLWSKTGFNLQVLPDGTVNGTRTDTTYSILQFVTFMMFSSLSLKDEEQNYQHLVSIRGVNSKMYVCMNSAGVVYASKSLTEECKFKEEWSDNKHSTYSSVIYPARTSKKRWYLSIGKNGKTRRGSASKKHHKTTLFLPRPLSKYICPPWICKLHTTDCCAITKALTTPTPAIETAPSWENCKKKNKKKCCKGLSSSDAKKCRRKYNLTGKKGRKGKKGKNSRKRKGKKRTGKKNRRRKQKKT